MDKHRTNAWYRRLLVLSPAVLGLAVCLAAMASRPARAEVLRLTQSAGLDQLPRINRAGQVV